MQTQKILTAFLALIVLYSFSFDRVGKRIAVMLGTDTSMSPLAIYGEQVYKRENCSSCHSQIDEHSNGFVSLDGIGGRFPNAWHYQHLEDPRSIRIESGMPAYAYLENMRLDKKVFEKIATNKYGNLDAEKIASLWNQLNVEVDSMYADLQRFRGGSTNKTEMLALIAYLQQIPASAGRMKSDSIALQQQKEEEAAWRKSIADNNSVLMKSASNNKGENVKAGKQLFLNYCTSCHGKEGGGLDGLGPNLTDAYWLHGGNLSALVNTLVFGIPDKGMKSWRYEFTPTELGQLVAYVTSLKGSTPSYARPAQGVKE